MFGEIPAPCPALTERDGKLLCGMVLMEAACPVDKIVAKTLGIGCGCSMPDEDTNPVDIARFDAFSRSKLGMKAL